MRVDRSALRVNQAFIVVLTVAAFLLGEGNGGGLILLGTGIVMAAGTLDSRLALFQQVYHRLLKPAGIVRPHVVAESPAPHRFAQGLGAAFLLAAAVSIFAGAPTIGWVLSWVVTALAAVNVAINFCAGCFFYFQLQRLGLLRTAGPV